VLRGISQTLVANIAKQTRAWLKCPVPVPVSGLTINYDSVSDFSSNANFD
jgi:hypothetical protein